MLIRSQDKKSLINLNNVTSLFMNKNRIHAYYNDLDNYDVIGEYSSDEKAIKVLDMIQDVYKKAMFGPGGKDALSGEMFQPFGFVPPKVFEMPQDVEVDV